MKETERLSSVEIIHNMGDVGFTQVGTQRIGFTVVHLFCSYKEIKGNENY